MTAISGMLLGTQIVLAVFMIVFCLQNYGGGPRVSRLNKDDELAGIKALRGVKLAEPLSEKTRPRAVTDIIGQEAGMKALMAAVCGPNPAHVIIYGPPGCGKTAAARAVFLASTSFGKGAPFIELDGTVLQFDERGVADPLIGSVHDPIYQGAGAHGAAGVPYPRPGAVTKAHGGILFIDEIGELNALQMNRLLKVLEDRRVHLHSAYYAKTDRSIPACIHDIFENGLPADFRLVGATTKSPDSLPEALRSRCRAVYFEALGKDDLALLARRACAGVSLSFENGVPGRAADFAANGRDAVNIIQTAASLAALEGRHTLNVADVEWAAASGKCQIQPGRFILTGGAEFKSNSGNVHKSP